MTLPRNRPREGLSSQEISLWTRGDAWLDTHANKIAAIVLALGFLARIWVASGTFLNPDEAQHFLVANRTSLALAYRSSLTLAHPPLLILFLYFWRFLGDSELVLRMSSILAGISFCFVFFKWLAAILGRKTALIGLIFVCFLPPLVSLSAEVRQYSLLLLFMAWAAYLFERSLAEDSARAVVLFSISLYLAMLSHYSALFFAASIGIYAVIRFAENRHSMKVVLAWLFGQACALALFFFLYRTHISKLKGSSMAEQATEGWLRRSYFHPGEDHILPFIVGRAFGVFQFIFGQLAIGDVMGLCFIGGVTWLLWRKHNGEEHPAKSAGPKRWQLAILFLLPFALNCAAAIVGAYPFGGTRHSVSLVILTIAGISLFLAQIIRRNVALPLAIVFVVLVACSLFGKPHHPYMTRADQSRLQMERSLAFIQQQIPQSEPILIDVQTRMLLGYYLCREEQDSVEVQRADLEVLQCGGYQLITANLWRFGPDTLRNFWSETIRTYGLKPGDPVWVVQEGWDIGAGPELKASAPEFKDLKIESFGANIQLFELKVGQPQAFSAPAHAMSLRPEPPGHSIL